MIHLPKTISSWQTPSFSDTLKQELAQLDVNTLPLQAALSHTNFASSDNMKVLILSITDDETNIQAKVGIFFTGIMYGCQCDDDPTPANEQTEYCELMFHINKNTANSTVSLLS